MQQKKSNLQIALESIVDVVAIAATTVLAALKLADSSIALLLIGLLAGVRITDVLGKGGGTPGGSGGLAGALVGVFLHRGQASVS